MAETILAIESASETCSVALLHDDEISSDSTNEPRGHANRLLPMIESLLTARALSVADLDAIAVTNGPGAFTSVRIGTAVCQGLAAASNLPVITASSLEVMAIDAIQQGAGERAMVALDARMEEVYFGIYELNSDKELVAIQPDQVSKPNAINLPDIDHAASWLSAGMGWKAYLDDMAERFNDFNLTPIDLDFPDAKALLGLARMRWRKGQVQNVRTLRPVYLRDNVVNS
jgi:tRNA threonylcarbamoyladenosine biosynthesis protein TsaB